MAESRLQPGEGPPCGLETEGFGLKDEVDQAMQYILSVVYSNKVLFAMPKSLLLVGLFCSLLVTVHAGSYVRSVMNEVEDDLTQTAVTKHSKRGGYIASMAAPPETSSPPALEALGEHKDKLPASWDWRAVPVPHLNTTLNMVTPARNQHIPNYCGSCWLFGSSSALQDRFKIARGGAFPEIFLSPQHIINCAHSAGDCDGGASSAMYAWVKKHGIVDETCMSYEARNMECTPETICRNCNPDGTCYAMKEYKRYFVEEHGIVRGVEAMKAEIYSRGPIVCSIMSTDWSWNFTGSGIMFDPTWDGSPETDHEVNVLGWGEEDGTPYWIIRNSWGTYWGDNGFFKLPLGKNYLNVESECSWATPKMDGLTRRENAPQYPNYSGAPWNFFPM